MSEASRTLPLKVAGTSYIDAGHKLLQNCSWTHKLAGGHGANIQCMQLVHVLHSAQHAWKLVCLPAGCPPWAVVSQQQGPGAGSQDGARRLEERARCRGACLPRQAHDHHGAQ